MVLDDKWPTPNENRRIADFTNTRYRDTNSTEYHIVTKIKAGRNPSRPVAVGAESTPVTTVGNMSDRHVYGTLFSGPTDDPRPAIR